MAKPAYDHLGSCLSPMLESAPMMLFSHSECLQMKMVSCFRFQFELAPVWRIPSAAETKFMHLATSIEKLIQPLFARKLFNFKISWTNIIWICNTRVSFFIRVTIVVFFILTINFQEASNSKSFEIMQRIMASYRGRIITTASPLRREVSRVLAEPSDKNLHSWGFSGPICPNSLLSFMTFQWLITSVTVAIPSLELVKLSYCRSGLLTTKTKESNLY